MIDMQEDCLVGSWEDILNKNIEVKDEKLVLKGFKLTGSDDKQRPSKNDFDDTRRNIIDSVIDRLGERFEAEEKLIKIIEPFQTFKRDADIRKIHELFGSDLDLMSLKLQFNELIDQNIAAKFQNNIGQIIKALTKNQNYREIMVVLSRIHICTQHSSDCERCISANNRIKTPSRSRILLETEVRYLYIHFNMPSLEARDPRPAIKLWMDEKVRRDRSTIIDAKSTQQPYFKGTFEAAATAEDDDSWSSIETSIKQF